MNWHIRASTDFDVSACAAIYAASVASGTASWEYEAPSEEEFGRRRAANLAQGFPFLVAARGDEVLGYAYASGYRARIGYRFVVEDSVYVAASSQGQGVGKALLTALIAACQEKGYRHMIAVIGDSDNAASIRLHESCGFETVGVFRGIGYKFERWLDSVQMLRRL